LSGKLAFVDLFQPTLHIGQKEQLDGLPAPTRTRQQRRSGSTG
jgi:hypothetical protein